MEARKTDTSGKMMLKEIAEGLNQPQKALPSKYFYDERGSELFETICEQEEYYLSRAEVQIMQDNIEEIVQLLGTGVRLIEPGSGNSRKTRLLLNHLPEITAYLPVEISETFLATVVDQLSLEYPALNIHPVIADYTRMFELPAKENVHARNVVFYPGSSIGNFAPQQAQQFLGMLSELTKKDGGLLIGVDLKKDPEILEAAYNDAEGVTAMFNKNLLLHINRALEADFNIDGFEHRARYNAEKGRIEMHLVSLYKQSVAIGTEEFRLEKGEYIHTENSYKYTIKEFQKLASPYFRAEEVWTDQDQLFSVQYFSPY